MDRQKSAAPSLWQLWLALLGRLSARLRFRRALAAARHTPAGVAVRLELLCARRGRPRRAGQTPREFLLALRDAAPAGDVLAREGFLALADSVDSLCFGEAGQQENPPARQVKAMLRAAPGRVSSRLPSRRREK